MFRIMRRFKQQMDMSEVEEILRTSTSGVLSVMGDDGYPYGVPVSYRYADGKIHFHSAAEGHKVDSIRNNDKVCFTIIHRDDVQPKELLTLYESVIVFGRAAILEDPEKKREALLSFAGKYSADYPDEIEAEMKTYYDETLVFEITIDHVTGKKAKGLMGNIGE